MNTIIYIALTTVIFLIMMKIHKRFPYPILMPLIPTTVIIIAILLIFNIPYSDYMEGGKWLQNLLGPAVVALAYPLYNQRHLVLKYKYTIISGLFIAMITGLISVFIVLKLFDVSKEFILTAIPKSLTTPIAMQVSEAIGGIPSLTAVLVMVAGFTGALLGPVVYKIGKVDSPISRGISMGSASHGVGCSKLKDYGEEDLSIGSISMSLSAVIGAIICPIFVFIFL